jgi:2-desacetyl-2-hydroxyethyl bacteriochlorophyllide A dehydrogenase
MKASAIVFTGVNKVEIQKHEVSPLRSREVLVRTEYSGVSQGTEIWALVGKRPELTYPTIPGYQSVGVIEEIGPDVTDYQVGQRVLFGTTRLPETCTPTWMACHVSHGVVPISADRAPQVLPDGVDPVGAALAYLPAVSLRGIRMIDVNIGDLVVVTGQGLIGQGSAQLAKLRGGIVIATDLSPNRLRLSKQFSADVVVNPNEQNLADVVRSIRPKGADAVIETTGRADQFAPCVDLLRWEGHLLLQGYYPQPVTFSFHDTHMKKPRVAVTCGCDAGEAQTCMQLMRYGKLNFTGLATHVVGVNQAPEMYERLRTNDDSVLGVVFDWSKLT